MGAWWELIGGVSFGMADMGDWWRSNKRGLFNCDVLYGGLVRIDQRVCFVRVYGGLVGIHERDPCFAMVSITSNSECSGHVWVCTEYLCTMHLDLLTRLSN